MALPVICAVFVGGVFRGAALPGEGLNDLLDHSYYNNPRYGPELDIKIVPYVPSDEDDGVPDDEDDE